MQARSRGRQFLIYAGVAIPAVAVGVFTAILLFGISLKVPRDVASNLSGVPARPKIGLGNLARHPNPRPMPDITFADASGQQRRLSEWRGRFVLLNLWATWCAPCKVEMPALDRLQAQKGSAQFEVIALSTDRAGARLPREFYEKTGITHLALYVDDTAEANVALKPGGLPATLLIDRDGHEIARLLGPAEWDTADAAKALETLFGARF